MAAPAVRSLQSLIKEQSAALKPQYDLIDADIAAAAESGKAQEAGLQATAQRTYKQIEQGAENKGMFFSGFSPSEQAEYNATTYLPALANLQSTIAQARSGLLKEKAGLGYKAFETATNLREGDLDKRFTYNERVAGQKFQSSEAAKERQFTAQENARDRAASAAQAAKAAAQGDIKGTVGAVGAYLKKRVGSDGKVSPATFQQGRQIWVSAGGDPAAYAQSFYGYVNRSHEDDYF